ncbi:MAG: hypothetical protein EBY40_07005, partial [Marivivens sp.]|nr:hypothetical protein [Marivivens sp.]NDH02861.1 hypothetical protein [Marivivens sp.]
SVDTALGVPMLVLSNGGRAQLVSGSDSDKLVFNYTVQPTDRNSQDLGVLGFAENDARILDAGGNRTDVRIALGATGNNLSALNDVVINAQSPYVRNIDVVGQSQDADDTYIAGEKILLTASFSEAVLVEGTPSLVLSNGGRASYVGGAGTSILTFEYVVPAGAVSQLDIDVTRLSLGVGGEIKSALSQNAASLAVRAGLLSDSSDVTIDTELPQGVISVDATALKSGQTANVTITFNEAVYDPYEAIEVSNGTLSALVSDTSGGSDNNASMGRVWTGVFTPNDDIEIGANTLVLNNALVKDTAGNMGVGLSSSNAILIDTQGPQATITGATRPDNTRLITLNFGEPVSQLTADKVVVTNGQIEEFAKLSESTYTILVAPKEDNPTGLLEISLSANAVGDAMGNLNAAMPVSHKMPWDVTAPRITQMSALENSYKVGATIDIDVTFSEAITVSGAGVPFLALDNGRVADYVSGSDSNVLRFTYVVQPGDEASKLDVVGLIENGATLKDAAGNNALVGVTAGLNNLAKDAIISIDAVVPVVTSIRAQADGLFKAGDEVLLSVQFSEDVTIAPRDGAQSITPPPVLTLSNGAVATYVETPDRDPSVLHFVYEVQQGDNDIRDLDVFGLAENGAVIKDLSDNVASVEINNGLNNLALRHDVTIDADWPRIADIAAQAGSYRAGDEIEIAVAMSKGIALDLTQGDPDLLLSNGSIAVFDAAASSSTKLMFTYQVTANDTEASDLSVTAVRLGNARMTSLVAGTQAQVNQLGYLEAPELPLAGTPLVVDLTPPEVVSIALADTMLSAGETTVVTVTLSEPVTQLEKSYFTVQHGQLSSFSTADGGVTWTALYTPLRNVAADDLVISLDASRIGDKSGNLGVGVATSAAYEIDSVYPVASLRSDTSGVATGPVKFIVSFSEVLAAGSFTAEDVIVENGSDPIGFKGPNASNEYEFVVEPLPNSTQPIKVRIPEGAVRDVAGNINPASNVLLQPVDTDPAEIVEIVSSAGAYMMGETVSLRVRFSEAVSLDVDPSISDHKEPELYLNNGQTARYVSGAGTDSWVFEYLVTPLVDEQGNPVLDQNGDPEVIDRDPLTVMSFLPNDTMPVDGAGVALDVRLPASKVLGNAVIVDTSAPVVAGFSAPDGSTYALGDVVYITAAMSEAVFVSTAGGAPSLALSNGGVATYVAGSGTPQLLFRYLVRDTDADSADLGVTSFALNGAVIADRAGNAVDGDVVAGVNDLAATHAVRVDASAPDVVRVDLVEDAGTLSDVVNDGYYKAGTVVALEVTFDEAVVVDATSGTPVLNLSNGGLAQYVGHAQDGTGAPIA